MSKPVQVEVVLSHSEHLPAVDVWLVVDILRASTVMVRWFELGGSELYPAESIESALCLSERLGREGRAPLLMGERNAIPPQGFHLGNSPLDITKDLTEKHPCAIIATTNGTKAMLKAADTGTPVLVACARNAFAALDLALSMGGRIGIFCSGRRGRPAWDDTLCAGLLISYLMEHLPNTHLADSARLAYLTWRESRDFCASLKTADHAIFLDKIGYGGDIDFAGEIDTARTVPMLHELPDGDGMLAVLREGLLNKDPLVLDYRPVSEAQIGALPEPELPRIEIAIPGETGTDIGHIFFAGEGYKKQQKSKSKK